MGDEEKRKFIHLARTPIANMEMALEMVEDVLKKETFQNAELEELIQLTSSNLKKLKKIFNEFSNA